MSTKNVHYGINMIHALKYNGNMPQMADALARELLPPEPIREAYEYAEIAPGKTVADVMRDIDCNERDVTFVERYGCIMLRYTQHSTPEWRAWVTALDAATTIVSLEDGGFEDAILDYLRANSEFYEKRLADAVASLESYLASHK